MPNSAPSEPAHSPLSPSASKRWLTCRASVGFIQSNKHLLPPDKGSPHALEGQEAHTFAERLFKGGKVQRPRSSEMVACIEEGYVPFVRAEARKLGITRFAPEVRVPLFYDRSQRGTCDAPLIGKTAIKIVDLKYGEGVSVEAKFNTQLAIYGESLIQDVEQRRGTPFRDSTPVELVIYQPRARDNRFVRRWPLTRGELRKFCKPIRDTAHEIIMDPDDQPFHADAETVCRWCPAKGICSHYAAHLLEELPPSVAKPLATVEMKLHLPKPAGLTDNQLVRIVRVAADVKDWLKEVEEHVTSRMTKGHKYDGFKLVPGRSNRQWIDEAKARAVLQEVFKTDELYSRAFKSPAQIGDLIKGLPRKPSPRFLERVAKMIVKPIGEPRLAVRDDPSPAVDIHAELL